MSYIQSVYINALLADASYIDLPIGKVDADSERYKELSTRMTFIVEIHSRQFRSHQQQIGQ